MTARRRAGTTRDMYGRKCHIVAFIFLKFVFSSDLWTSDANFWAGWFEFFGRDRR